MSLSSYQRLLASLAVAFAVAGCQSLRGDEITVRRINLVDERGQTMFVLAGDVPGTMHDGKEHKRSIDAAGIVWHDRNGDESGGLAVATAPTWKGARGGGNVRMLTFDFTHQLTDAVRVGTFESGDGKIWSGGLTVFDRRPVETGPLVSSQGKERIYLGTENGDAGLVIRDAQERERIRIGVDRNGAAVIEILNEAGEVVKRVTGP